MWRQSIVLIVSVTALAGAWLLGPVAQDPTYHDFADQRRLLGLPNFWNVATNLPFLFAGVWGLLVAKRIDADLVRPAIVFAAGVILVAFGSAWYHLMPDNASLVWDRLPMTISFMAFFSFALTMVYGAKTGRIWLLPLLACGVASIIYWDITEAAGQGDLRWYGLVQFLPAVLIVLFVCLYPQFFQARRYLWLAIGAYALAKLLEWQDGAIWDAGNLLSGHSLKHLAAALGAYYGLSAMLAESSASHLQRRRQNL
jgi:hypothetical protein